MESGQTEFCTTIGFGSFFCPRSFLLLRIFLTFIPQLAYKNYIFFFRYGPGVLASAQAISEPACLRGDGLGHTRDLPRGRRLEAR
jgi:hypothetical protein